MRTPVVVPLMRYASALVLLILVAASPAHALVASSDFREIIRRHRPELVRCYEASPERTSEPIVRLTLRLDIDGGGHVTSASATSASAGSALRACIEGAARTWMFPPGREGSITMTYPLVFAP